MTKKDKNPVICGCFDITRNEILKIIHLHHPSSVDEISLYCYACQSCRTCYGDIEKLLEEEKSRMMIQKDHGS